MSGHCARGIVALSSAALVGLGLSGVGEAKVNLEPPSAQEMAQLPQYCLWNFNRDKPEYQAPQFHVDKVFPNCGTTGTNFIHYCSGIFAMIRTNRPGADRQHRSYWIDTAQREFEYTKREISPYPNCGIREPLNAYLKRLEVMLKTLR